MASMGRPLDEDPQYAGVEEPELLACPFCGGEAVLFPYKFLVTNWKVICDPRKNKCLVKPETSWFTTREEAVAAWNRRAD